MPAPTVLLRNTATRSALVGATLLAFGLSFAFWFQFWTGSGLIGGDLYSYYMPQKVTYAQALAEGRLPLWNCLVGHGYPQHAESQTGIFYPPHLVAYWLWPTQTAYNLIQTTHYVIAFLAAWLCAGRFGLLFWGRVIAATVYTYGWFPPRLCLEWAIIGGAWLPVGVWGILGWWEERRWRWLAVVIGALTLQLLAGHFFFTFATLLGMLGVSLPELLPRRRTTPNAEAPGSSKGWLATGAVLAVAAAFLLSAVQLIPTWELKTRSQRAEVGARFNPGYGAIPPIYLTQVFGLWAWYQHEIDLNRLQPPGSAETNQIEAHLFFGTLPLLLFAAALIDRNLWTDRRKVALVLMALLAVLLAIDFWPELTRRLPGFSFFSGPGRYGVLTTLAVGLLAGWKFDRLTGWEPAGNLVSRPAEPSRSLDKKRTAPPDQVRASRFGDIVRNVTAWGLVGITAFELLLVSRLITNARMLPQSPLVDQPDSAIRKLLLDEPGPVRLFCRGANVATLLGFASTPVYLGIGPAAYADPARRLPDPWPFDEPPTPAQIDWLQRAGVTHVLSFHELDTSLWPVELLAAVPDIFLNAVWSRGAPGQSEPPFYLYRLQGSRGRVAWLEASDPAATAEVTSYREDAVQVTARSTTGGRLILTDLDYPGWTLNVDGQAAEGVVIDGMYRGVDLPAGEHTLNWTFQPASFWWGTGISAATALVLAGLGLRYRRAFISAG